MGGGFWNFGAGVLGDSFDQMCLGRMGIHSRKVRLALGRVQMNLTV